MSAVSGSQVGDQANPEYRRSRAQPVESSSRHRLRKVRFVSTQQALAEFLRTRRERLTPGDVGLPDSRRRRVKGLRREEVAQLAGISTDYYVRLEQGGDVRPSVQGARCVGNGVAFE
ncbi:helix-turn-helix domain-containing protein [Rhodococcus globerulus]|uniref:helix-turn-helix domain-containing protein n=1 Tax=Rhodococcus globerulus TaxID=33008 RepID=UPI00374ECADB